MGRKIKAPSDDAEEYEASSPDGYEQVFAGQPFPQREGRRWGLACCHCGLVHTVRIDYDGETRDGGLLNITMHENAAATKRHRKVPGEAPALDEAYARGYRDGIRRATQIRRMWQKAKTMPNKKAAP